MSSFKQAKGRKVVSVASAGTIGKVDDYIVDIPARRVAALVLKKTPGDGDTVPWERLSGFGEDAVTLADESVIGKADERLAALGAKAHRMKGKRVLDTLGRELGSVSDVEFDPQTGQLLRLLLKKADDVSADRLLASGSYAVVVDAHGPVAAAPPPPGTSSAVIPGSQAAPPPPVSPPPASPPPASPPPASPPPLLPPSER